jgi:hypothetical protein
MPPDEVQAPGGWDNDWREKHRAWLRLSYAERLTWLEDAKRFVARIRRMGESGSLEGGPEQPVRQPGTFEPGGG